MEERQEAETPDHSDLLSQRQGGNENRLDVQVLESAGRWARMMLALIQIVMKLQHYFANASGRREDRGVSVNQSGDSRLYLGQR